MRRCCAHAQAALIDLIWLRALGLGVRTAVSVRTFGLDLAVARLKASCHRVTKTPAAAAAAFEICTERSNNRDPYNAHQHLWSRNSGSAYNISPPFPRYQQTMIESEPFASALDSASRQRVKHDDDSTDTTDDCCCVKRGPLASDPMSGKATEIRVLSFKRPHMRAFHCSWISFFVSFFIWFAIVPLLPYIKDSLDLTERQIFISNLFNLIPTERLIVGPMCDRYGPRKVFLVLLSLASIPTACTGLVNSAAGLYIIRFFIGMAGGSFVICQYWSTAMFAPDIVGAANGFVGGWGNLGGGVTQLVVGTGLLPAFLTLMSPDVAWRTVSLIPAGLGLITGIAVFFISDDSPCPGGRHCRSIIAASATMAEHEGSLYDSVRSAYTKSATYVLFFHYMVSFGVELTMLGSIAMYFVEVFGLSNPQASAVASVSFPPSCLDVITAHGIVLLFTFPLC